MSNWGFKSWGTAEAFKAAQARRQRQSAKARRRAGSAGKLEHYISNHEDWFLSMVTDIHDAASCLHHHAQDQLHC